MDDTNSHYLTAEGIQKLREELDHLINVRRPEVARQIADAKADGDISENAGYAEAKNTQAFVEGRILTLRNILGTAVIIDHTHSNGTVDIGCKVTIRDVADRPGVAAEVFSALAAENVNVDMIIQNVSEAGSTDISFTVPMTDLVRARKTAEAVVAELGARTWSVDESIAKVSLVGAGMKTHPGVAAQMFRALSEAGVNIDMISTSTIRVTCVVAGEQVAAAVQALHDSFGLADADVTLEHIPGCGEGE